LVTACLFLPLAAAIGQNQPLPEECEAAKIWQATRDQRIEQEFQRRGIFDSAEKQMNRAEVERVIDERIRILTELCEQKKK
jgi:hypothetical protein